MGQFQDTAGRKWSIEIDYAAVRRTKERTGVDLLKAIPRDKESKENPLIVELTFNPILMVDVVHAILEPQIEKAGVTPEEFGQSISVEHHVAMSEAFWDAYIVFFQNLGWEHVVKAIQEHLGATKSLIKKSATTITNAAKIVMKGMDKKLEKTLEQVQQEMEEELEQETPAPAA